MIPSVSDDTYKEYFEGYEIIDCAILNPDEAYFLLAKEGQDPYEDELDRLLVRWMNDAWSGLEFMGLDTQVMLGIADRPERRLFLTDDDGYCYSCNGDDESEESSIPHDEYSSLGEVRGIAGGRAHAVGTYYNVFRREGEGNWARLNLPIRFEFDEEGIVKQDVFETGFYAIDGFSETDIYACGSHGILWHYDGKDLRQKDAPTNLDLEHILCAPDGSVYISGMNGVFIRGRGNRWEQLDPEDVTHYGHMTWFNDELYIGGTALLYKLAGDKVQWVDFPQERRLKQWSTGSLSSTDDYMVVAGKGTIRVFDGFDWHLILDK